MEKIEDMILTDAEMGQVRAIMDSYGDEAGERTALDIQATKYREKHLNVEKIKSSSRMCYSEGRDKYTRKDLKPISMEDVRAVDMKRMGQGHGVSHGEYEIIHDWYVDSSD